MTLFIRKSAKLQCSCFPKWEFIPKEKRTTPYSLLTQKGKSLKVWSTICSRCVSGFLRSKILEAMEFKEVIFLTNENLETAKLPSFLERL